jgi:trans-2,3-dihydro-3-hydroxyanthranilate isomerase
MLEEGVGPVAVELEVDERRAFVRLKLETGVQHPAERPSAAAAAAALSLPAEAVREAWFASVGVPFVYLQLADREAVDRAKLDHAAWERGFTGAFATSFFFFAGELAPGGSLYARMFAPDMGIVEDPATGAASATLAGSLAERAGGDGTHTWQIDQGVAMGRPSRIEASARTVGGRTVAVMAGGSTVIVAEGTITLPEGW